VIHKKSIILLIIASTFFFILACNLVNNSFSSKAPETETLLPTETKVTTPSKPSSPTPTFPQTPETFIGSNEVNVQVILLQGKAAQPHAEISGLAWYEDHLILLPQYPRKMGNGDAGFIFSLPKAKILDYIQADSQEPLDLNPIPIIEDGLELDFNYFDGYEAIVFQGDKAFLSIEMRGGASSVGYLVSGKMSPDLSKLELDPNSLTLYYPPLNLPNMSDEALFISGESLFSLYEVNGLLNPKPYASKYDFDLNETGQVSFPKLEYRLTDATALDAENRFWVINYFFPGEEFLKPKHDPLAEEFGSGASHQKSEIVERLVELELNSDGISLSGTAPIQLAQREDGEARNWEGIVRLEKLGFLIVTDKFPETIFGFVPYP
jgi:hypothetical protein